MFCGLSGRGGGGGVGVDLLTGSLGGGSGAYSSEDCRASSMLPMLALFLGRTDLVENYLN